MLDAGARIGGVGRVELDPEEAAALTSAAAQPVDPDPQNGPRTVPSGGVASRTTHRISASGLTVGGGSPVRLMAGVLR